MMHAALLHDNVKTTDENVERINFQKDEEVLVKRMEYDIWSKTVIDSHAVHAEFVTNEEV